MAATVNRTAGQGVIVIEGHELSVTNPNKPLWPEAGITKLTYLQKLIALSPYLLTYTRNRYLTTIRYPHGIHGKSFYQKNAPEPLPSFVRTATFGGIRYVVLDSLPTLVWLANLACLEFHPSLHYVGEGAPAEWLLDIDPSLPEEPRLMQAVAIVGETLDAMRIRTVPKTSGATGVQIYAPIRPGYTFEQLREVGHFIGRYLTVKHPDLFTIERLKKDRGDRIYIDYLQHWHGKTLSAPYTPRARPHATVSAPLTWDEVNRGVDPREFTLLTMEARLNKHGDLIAACPPQSFDHVLRLLS